MAHPSTPVAGWQTKPLEAPPDPTRIGLVPQQTTYGWARPDPLPKLPGKLAQPLPGSSTEGGPGGREKEEDSYCSGWMREGRKKKRQKKKIFLPPHFLLRGPIIHFHDFFTKIDYIQI